MDNIWMVLGIDPTEDVSAIKRAYAERAKTCHPEEDPEGFLQLRQAYQAALDYAGGTGEKPGFSTAGPLEEEPAPEEEQGWSLREQEEDGPNPYEGGEAITKFMELHTRKQRKSPVMWMNYVTSDAFLDAAWDPRFTALLLRKVREVLADVQPNRECMTWLNVAYQFSGKEARSFDGMEDILQIAALGPAPKTPQGNEFAILQSFLDYRHLNSLADAGRWDQEAIEGFRVILNRYSSAYIRERCEQRVTPDCERHPAGVRVFLHFFRREDLPDTLFREAWQRLNLKSAVMGRAKALYGPLRELAVQRVPGIDGEAPVISFLQLNRNLDAYLKRIRVAPETEPAESEAFFRTPEMQQALPVPRFLEQQLLTYSPWRREGMGGGLVRRILDYYRAHTDIPRAGEVIAALADDLRLCEAKRWSREDEQADPEGIPYDERLTLRHRPLLRWWLNTAFYTAQDPETGTPLLERLEKYLPYQASWSRRFALRKDGTPRTIAAAMGAVEIDCYPMHMEYRVNGKPVYRPCLTWEQTARESGDGFALLLPITVAPYSRFNDVAQEIYQRLNYFPIPQDDWPFVARCLAGYVCCLLPDQETREAPPPEKALPLELSMEGGGKLYTAVWREGGESITIYQQTDSGRRMLEELMPDPDGTWTAAPSPVKRPLNHEKDFPPIRFTAASDFEAARRRLAELTDPRFFDLSRLRELPCKIFYTSVGGIEEGLSRIDILREPPKVHAEAFLAEWEGVEDIPPDMEPIIAKVRRAVEEQPKEEEPIPPEVLVTAEALSTLLYRFSQDELERLEMEWMEGRLALRRDGDKYACLYFENSFGRGERWYALLADPETYRTVDGDVIRYLPFGMGKLAEYSIFHSAQDLLRDIDQVLGQMGYNQIQDGGPGGWLWSGKVYRQDAKHKVLMMQQKLGGIPALRGRSYHLAKFVLSRPAAELETVDLGGERTVTALKSGTYGLAATGLVGIMSGKLERVRISWTFQTPEGGAELRHLVLLQEQGKYMMFWLQDGDRQALAYGADEPRRFMGRALPGCLVHEEPRRLRNGIDLLLDDIDNTEPVLRQPGQFALVHVPYEELRSELVHEAT
jgi:hypothetical protein